VRPGDVNVFREEREDSIEGIIAGTLSLPMKNATILTIHTGEHEVHARTLSNEDYPAGHRVWLTFKRYHVFDKESGMRLRSYPEAL
jgi:hypothetical protein